MKDDQELRHDHENHDHEHHQEEKCHHEHHQEHEHHDHGHHDHHEHSHEQFPLLDIDQHDAALIGTIRCRIDGAYDTAVQELESAMSGTAEDVERQGGLVGHIKAFAKEENRSCMLSLTEPGPVHNIPSDRQGVMAEIANIVFGLDEGTFREILQKNYGKWL